MSIESHPCPQLCAEGPDGDIYCKLCYAYKHGHKAKPNLNVADVAAIPGDSGEMDVCPRSEGREERGREEGDYTQYSSEGTP